jgi:Beta/Gamma crystallin/CVNH domain
MKRAATIAAGIAGLMMALCGAADAAPIPQGSYRTTCEDIHAGSNTLTATCRTRRGDWSYTTLGDYRDCQGDIANVDGRLKCQGDWQDGDDWLPPGSYRESCRDEEMRRGTLTAECKDRNARWRYTELANVRSCRGDIFNADGILRCRRGGGDLPGGSWRSSCRSERIYSFVLYAECRDRRGNWRETSVDLRDCDDDVRNDDGRLVCEDPGFAQITLYKHANFGGASRTFSTDIPDLGAYGFGNQSSSVVVQGGIWQLCDRPNYRGYCIVIDRAQANLWTFGFDDRTESVRRVR